MKKLLSEIKGCTLCAEHLENGCRPVMAASTSSKIAIIGQAPGSVVHRTGVPWDDRSGENLRSWMGITPDTFYDVRQVGIVPMGFCYPGKGKSGDLPPRKECAPLWHPQLFEKIQDIKLILLIGQYAQGYYLGKQKRKTLTETVRCYEDYLPEYFVLPHPSPRNNIWMAKNKWFASEILPVLKSIVKNTLKV